MILADFLLTWIRFWTCFMKQARIRVAKMKWIQTDLYPQHCKTPIFFKETATCNKCQLPLVMIFANIICSNGDILIFAFCTANLFLILWASTFKNKARTVRYEGISLWKGKGCGDRSREKRLVSTYMWYPRHKIPCLWQKNSCGRINFFAEGLTHLLIFSTETQPLKLNCTFWN